MQLEDDATTLAGLALALPCSPVGGILPSLDACLQVVSTTKSIRQQSEACSLAAILLLRQGRHPALAVKLSSRAAIQQSASRSAEARALVKECTQELELQGRSREMQESLMKGVRGDVLPLTASARELIQLVDRLIVAEDDGAEAERLDVEAALGDIIQV